MTFGFSDSGIVSNRSCWRFSGVFEAGLENTYGVHASYHDKVGRAVIPGGDKEAVTLSSSQIDHVGLCWLCIHAIDFDDCHGMAFDPEVLAGKGSDVRHTEEVSCARSH